MLSILKILVSVERVLPGFLTFLQPTKWLHLPTLPNNNGLADRPCGRLLLILIYTLIKTMTKFSNVVGCRRPDLLWSWDHYESDWWWPITLENFVINRIRETVSFELRERSLSILCQSWLTLYTYVAWI